MKVHQFRHSLNDNFEMISIIYGGGGPPNTAKSQQVALPISLLSPTTQNKVVKKH